MAEKSASLDDTENCKEYTIPSNEEIVNELTKDLHSACINTAEKNSSIDNECSRRKSDQTTHNVGTSEEKDENSSIDNERNRRKSDQTTHNVGTSEEKDETDVTPGCYGKESENEKDHVKDEDDVIDEEAMKDQENMYTEEDKEVFSVCTCMLGHEVRLHIQ